MTEHMPMKLYEFGPTRSIRARWTLQELDVPFEAVMVNLPKGEHRCAEFSGRESGRQTPCPGRRRQGHH